MVRRVQAELAPNRYGACRLKLDDGGMPGRKAFFQPLICGRAFHPWSENRARSIPTERQQNTAGSAERQRRTPQKDPRAQASNPN